MPRNSQLERTIQKALTAEGVSFRSNVKGLPGTPDFVFDTDQAVLFIHGCYWHRHSNCARAAFPRGNISEWLRTFNDQVVRDHVAHYELVSLGWESSVLWECEFSELDMTDTHEIASLILGRSVRVEQPESTVDS